MISQTNVRQKKPPKRERRGHGRRERSLQRKSDERGGGVRVYSADGMGWVRVNKERNVPTVFNLKILCFSNHAKLNDALGLFVKKKKFFAHT